MNFAALHGLIGIVILLVLAYLLSSHRKAINLRTVGFAFILQILLGAFVLYLPFGKDVLASITNGVQQVINSANAGIDFVFGGLGTQAIPTNGIGFVFALHVLPVIIFFSSLIAVLYHLNIMQWVIKVVGGGLQKLLNTSKPESLSATANIFVGQTEAPLVVRPYIAKMSQSELFAIMVGGLASVAGSILAGYANLGVELKYLIAASFMAAPGGLLMAKIILPETEHDKVKAQEFALVEPDDKPVNVIDAAASGAASGLKLAANVGAMLLADCCLCAGPTRFVTTRTVAGLMFTPPPATLPQGWQPPWRAQHVGEDVSHSRTSAAPAGPAARASSGTW